MLVTLAGSSLFAAVPAFAGDDASNAAMLKLIEQQSAQIKQLEARLAAVETQKAAAAADAQVPETKTQADTASADAQQHQLDALQAQLTQLSASSNSNVKVRWTDGVPEFRSSDGFFAFEPRARILIDVSSTHGSDYDARNLSGSEGRDLRLGATGSVGALNYKIDIDFSSQATAVKDVWLGTDTKLFGVPTTFTFGNKLKDRGIETPTAATRTPFMERNAVAAVGQGVAGSYGLGGFMTLYGSNWHLGTSITGDDLSSPGSASDSLLYTVRGHWNPLKGTQGFVHVGSWYWYEKIADDITSISNTTRVGQNFNDNLTVSAGSIASPTHDEAYGYELGGVFHSLWALGEYTKRTIASSAVDTSDRTASSIASGWLISGEKPGFSSRSGTWGATKVLAPVTSGGWGAWEIAVRFDRYDFRDSPDGGDARTSTIGVNWYLNDWARLMLNYVDWKTNNRSGSFQGLDTGNSIGLRTQIAF